MSNDFKNSLSLNAEQWKNAKNAISEKIFDNYEYYDSKYNNSQIQNYFHNVVAAIMLEHHKKYGTNIHIPYRFKSPKSLIEKTIDYIGRNDNLNTIKYNTKNDVWDIHLKEIKDMFAMKIISYTRKPIFNSSDSELNLLIEEKKQNYELLAIMQEFENTKLIKEEKYIYQASKKEYYQNCRELLKRIKTLIPQKAIKLIGHYEHLIDINNKIISLIEATGSGDEMITEHDLEILNFSNILEDFTERIHDKLDLAILTKQILYVFNNSELLNKLGLKINVIKEKRTINGYVANFLEVETLVGKIECQLQSKHEYEDGNYGFAAHTKLDSKYINPYKLPNINSEEEVKQFRDYAEFVSPKSFLAQSDPLDNNRVVIHASSKYQNYKNVINQIAKDSEFQEYMLKYFGKLYPNRNKIFEEKELDIALMRFDIEQYLEGEEFLKIKDKCQKEEIHDNER